MLKKKVKPINHNIRRPRPYVFSVNSLKPYYGKGRETRKEAAEILSRFPARLVEYEKLKSSHIFKSPADFHDFYKNDETAAELIYEVETVSNIYYSFPEIYRYILKERYMQRGKHKNSKKHYTPYSCIDSGFSNDTMQKFCCYVLYKISVAFGMIPADDAQPRMISYKHRINKKKMRKINKCYIPAEWLF